jgi:hypothetical protein
MKRSKSELNPFDLCNSFGRLLSFGVPNESDLNKDFYDAMHFVNTLEIDDPQPLDNNLLKFRRKH